MSPPVMKLKVTPKSILKGKMDVRFPANVEGEGGISVEKFGSTFTIKPTAGVIGDVIGPGIGASVTGRLAVFADGQNIAGATNLYGGGDGLGVGVSGALDAFIHVRGLASTHAAALKFTTYGGAVALDGQRSGGTPGSETAVLFEQTLVAIRGGGYNGSAFTGSQAQIGLFANEAWTPTALGTHLRINLTPNGSTTLTEILRVFGSGGFALGSTTDPGAGSLSVTGTVRTGFYTVATLPAAGTKSRRAFVSDANATTFASIVAGGGSNNVPVYDDGTNWRIG